MKTAVHDHFHVLNPPTTAYSGSNLETWGKDARSLKNAFRHSDQTISQSSTRSGRSLPGTKKGTLSVTGRHAKALSSLDRMKYREKWVIDVGGGHLRVIFFADFEQGKIFIKHISTHAEYDKLTDLYRRTKERIMQQPSKRQMI